MCTPYLRATCLAAMGWTAVLATGGCHLLLSDLEVDPEAGDQIDGGLDGGVAADGHVDAGSDGGAAEDGDVDAGSDGGATADGHVDGSSMDASGDAGTETPCDISTGFDGDEQCMEAPSPGTGFQIHFGPEAYDAESVEPFLIHPGEELVECIYLSTPNDAEVWTSEVHARWRPGAYTIQVYKHEGDLPGDPPPTGCSDQPSTFLWHWSGTEAAVDVGLMAPEHEGHAFRIGAGEGLRVEARYLNTSSAPILREAWINVLFRDPQTVTTELGSVFWIAQVGMSIPGRAEGYLVQGSCSMDPGFADPEILSLQGHFHANTQRLSAWLRGPDREARCTKADADGCTLLYEGYDYTSLPTLYFDSVTTNSAPDASTGVPGGDFSGNLQPDADAHIDWECEVDNPWDAPMGFGSSLHEAEMCNLYGFYAPAPDGDAWDCIIL